MRVLILGIGNLLWADEGFGVRVVQALERRYAFPPNVTLLDGGTQGLGLIPYVQACDTLVIADAVDFRQEPGSLLQAVDDEVPQYLSSGKLSLHQVSFQEVLALCRLMGQGPSRLCVVGVQPVLLEDYGGSLTPQVKAQLEPAMARILAYLQSLGIAAGPRDESPSDAALDMDVYERLRPSAQQACRIGDAACSTGAASRVHRHPHANTGKRRAQRPVPGPDGPRIVDTRLVGQPPAGAWLLVFMHAAREVIDAQRAQQIQDALLALQQAMAGDADLDRWFPDLAGREPQLPDFLQPPTRP
ncbi:HyaD/HybD family hydrogenase maturation endopeptidase [Methylogaea oryzae]|uniref:HyaD/HybD family hydrogenase maturation endopeptidase n=1 Tax=Methylogaea oryzae TaxID=1295382 RepID=UPI0009EBF985|nr:HyaD/HybD family hydrogenase maturation endopeptidase [Methylogaea oryzae]